jgi:uncharacterized protein
MATFLAVTEVFREGGVSYLRIPSDDPARSAAFYRDVFGWRVRLEGDSPAFEDATGHVIGHFRTDLEVGAAGVVPYVYVADVDETLAAVPAHGGRVEAEPYPEGDLWVATLRDPSGNLVGAWQRGPRRSP